MRVLIAGGGTGGHLYPGIAVAREWVNTVPDCRILFVGTASGLETRVLPEEGFELRTIPTAGWIGRGWRSKLWVLSRMPSALSHSLRILKEFGPDVVVGVGGYASGPLVLAAAAKRIPTIILEQNAFPGMTNRWLSFIVDRVIVAFPESQKSFARSADVRVLGNPVRPEIFTARTRRVASGPPTILVFGGSRGARAINGAVIEAIPDLRTASPGMTFIHQTGTEDLDRVRKAYEATGLAAEVQPYFHRMEDLYRRADLVICRAGATTVAELSAASRPAILIPYPYSAGGHQIRNAESLQAAGGAVMILEKDLSGKSLSECILTLWNEPGRLQQMAERSGLLARPDASREIVRACRRLAEEKRGTRYSGRSH
jgi:UDP-N-acetylglucosamine--N-acetylmuramyl-(pentapeptide) pyrophosphoryl-undecaprenol N-acetylglucosamine transferase